MILKKSIKHFCTYPNQGGAGIAAWRLVQGLRKRGLNADLVGLWKDQNINLPGRGVIELDRNPFHLAWRWLRKYKSKIEQNKIESLSSMPFYIDSSPLGQPMFQIAKKSDIIHLHWVNNFIDYQFFFTKLPIGVPIFWTLHDMSPFTGGCIHSKSCLRFKDSCGCCPLLGSFSQRDESEVMLKRKIKTMAPHISNMVVISPSRWLADLAGKSQVFSGARIEVIPNGFNLDIYTPFKRAKGRALIGAENGELVLLFTASALGGDLKGGKLFIESWKMLHERGVAFKVVCVGNSHGFHVPESWQILGPQSDEGRMAAIYAGADILVVPSEVENFPNVICEALACGVPVVGTHVGGIPELVIDNLTGFTVRDRSASNFAEMILRLSYDIKTNRAERAFRCREFAERHFSVPIVIDKHIKLYNDSFRN